MSRRARILLALIIMLVGLLLIMRWNSDNESRDLQATFEQRRYEMQIEYQSTP